MGWSVGVGLGVEVGVWVTVGEAVTVGVKVGTRVDLGEAVAEGVFDTWLVGRTNGGVDEQPTKTEKTNITNKPKMP